MKQTFTQQQVRNIEQAIVMWTALSPDKLSPGLSCWRQEDDLATSYAWPIRPTSNTKACFGGWCSHWPEFQRQGVSSSRTSGAPVLGHETAPFKVAEILFGDPYLFLSRGGHPSDLTVQGLSDHGLIMNRLVLLLKSTGNKLPFSYNTSQARKSLPDEIVPSTPVSSGEASMPTKHNPRVWVILARTYEGKSHYLVGKRGPSCRNPGQWGLFGGNVDAGETLKQAARRELYEETCLPVKEQDLVFVFKDMVKQKPVTWFAVDLPRQHENHIISIRPTAEVVEYAWADRSWAERKDLHYSLARLRARGPLKESKCFRHSRGSQRSQATWSDLKGR
jgi:8-oxo-dGTP pyrophosphatase MutT (NUDIX family)